MSREPSEGWHGWDDYAAFYDWENARTLGRRDVGFWQRLAAETHGPVLELGCGTGRLLGPMSRTGTRVVGIDRSAPMLDLARRRLRRLRRRAPALVRGDIRQIPLPSSHFALVVAGYGILQSLVRDKDLDRTLGEVARILRPGGVLGIDLVPDLPRWSDYRRRVTLDGRGAGGRRIRLVESVRQDRRRRLTVFDDEFVVFHGRGRRVTRHRFTLTFRTVGFPALERRLRKHGLEPVSRHGDYRSGPWTEGAETWLLLARKC